MAIYFRLAILAAALLALPAHAVLVEPGKTYFFTYDFSDDLATPPYEWGHFIVNSDWFMSTYDRAEIAIVNSDLTDERQIAHGGPADAYMITLARWPHASGYLILTLFDGPATDVNPYMRLYADCPYITCEQTEKQALEFAYFTEGEVAHAPIPAALPMLLAGLGSLWWVRRRRSEDA